MTLILPIPASPVTNAKWRSPPAARARRSWRRASSASRATREAGSPFSKRRRRHPSPRVATRWRDEPITPAMDSLDETGALASSSSRCRISRIHTVSAASLTAIPSQTDCHSSSFVTNRPGRARSARRTANALGVKCSASLPCQIQAFSASKRKGPNCTDILFDRPLLEEFSEESSRNLRTLIPDR